MGYRDRRRSLKMRQRKSHAKKIARDKRKLLAGKVQGAVAKKAPARKAAAAPEAATEPKEV